VIVSRDIFSKSQLRTVHLHKFWKKSERRKFAQSQVEVE